MNNENTEIEENEINHTAENVESVGQIILGELEKIGGILTGDPISQAEGDFNVEVGNLHLESNESLEESDEK